MALVKRFACGIEFDGSKYHGWQRQPKLETIQGNIERILSQIGNHDIHCHAAGRTDKGVHAKELVIHFDSSAKRSTATWNRALNALLPNDINCIWLKEVDQKFHARHSAIARTYEYKLCINPNYQPISMRHDTWWFPYKFCHKKLDDACNVFLGEHDFSGYRGRDCQANSPIKTIQKIATQKEQDKITISVTGNSFLHHMVRNIVGSLMLVAQGKQDLNWLKGSLKYKARLPEIPMAPAQGLTFIKAHYEIAEEISKD